MAFVPVLSCTLNFIQYQLYIEYLYIYLALFQIFIHLLCYLPKNIYIHKLSIVVNIHNVLCYIYVINIYAFDTMCYGNYRYFDAVPKFTVSCKIYIDVFVDVIKQRNFAYNVCKNAYLM